VFQGTVQNVSIWAALVARETFKCCSDPRQVFSSIWGCHMSNCFCDRHTKFIKISNFLTKHSSLYLTSYERIHNDYIGTVRMLWNCPPRPIHSRGKNSIQNFSHSRTEVRRSAIFVKENSWLKVSHLQDYK